MGVGKKVALAAGVLMLAGAVALGTCLSTGYTEAAAPDAGCGGTETEAMGQRFPNVNWDKQLAKNEDVVGWVSVPKTDVSYPIVQASEDDPTYYLNHNVKGDWSVWGCPYLSSDRAEAGLASSVPLIYGHHMNDGSMFSDLAKYTDKSWAKKHQKILVQTPEWRMVLKVRGARTVNAETEGVATGFTSPEALQEWLEGELGKCRMVLGSAGSGAEQGCEQVFVFCTCSYGTYANQRTLVYAVPESVEYLPN